MKVWGVVDENMGSSMKVWGSSMKVWGSSMRILGSSIDRHVGSSMKWGRRWVVDDDDFFLDSVKLHLNIHLNVQKSISLLYHKF